MIRTSTITRFVYVLSGLACVVILVSCAMHSGSPGSFGSGDFGATQGGVQDMGLARELVASGQVPPAEAFVVEGMFSEHELGIAGDPCQRILCLRSAIGVAPLVNGTPSAWMQIGMSSTINPETFQRPSLTLIATIDVSGSMGWDYVTENSEYPTPGEVSRNLLSAIAAELGPEDKIAIVTYGTLVHTVLSMTGGDDQVRIQAAIDALSTGGVTDMESGLRRAYQIANSEDHGTDQVRVMLFTDMQPNVGATEPSEFEEIAADGANAGVGLTVMGIGVGLRQELMNAITHLRGGNAFSLFNNDSVTELMDDDWPFLVSPIAYDMTLTAETGDGFVVTDAYGFPSSDEGDTSSLDVATVFLSRRKGALLLRIEPQSGTDLTGLTVNCRLTYQTPEGETVNGALTSAYTGQPLDQNGQYFEQVGVQKTVALALLVSNMHGAAEQYGEDPELAVQTMTLALARYASDIEGMEDENLANETALAVDLLSLMEQRAEQGDLYGYGN